MQVKQYGSLIYIKCKHTKSFYTFMYMLIYKNKEFSSDFQVIFLVRIYPPGTWRTLPLPKYYSSVFIITTLS